MPTLEETIATEQAEHDAQTSPPAAEAPNGQGTLVDPADYTDPELALPKVDGESIDKIELAFSGRVFLDRSSKADVALFRDLKLGRDVTLMVEARCQGTGATGSTNREGDLDVVVGGKRLKVHSVYRPAAEDLETELERTGVEQPDEEAA